MYAVIYLDSNGKEQTHDYRAHTKQLALGIGHELCRDFVASWFRIVKVDRQRKNVR